MKIEFSKSPIEKRLSELKARYGDDWSIEATSFLGPLIHYTARSSLGRTYRPNERISREELKLLNADRLQRGLPEIHAEGGWR